MGGFASGVPQVRTPAPPAPPHLLTRCAPCTRPALCTPSRTPRTLLPPLRATPRAAVADQPHPLRRRATRLPARPRRARRPPSRERRVRRPRSTAACRRDRRVRAPPKHDGPDGGAPAGRRRDAKDQVEHGMCRTVCNVCNTLHTLHAYLVWYWLMDYRVRVLSVYTCLWALAPSQRASPRAACVRRARLAAGAARGAPGARGRGRRAAPPASPFSHAKPSQWSWSPNKYVLDIEEKQHKRGMVIMGTR